MHRIVFGAEANKELQDGLKLLGLDKSILPITLPTPMERQLDTSSLNKDSSKTVYISLGSSSK